jgi:hypothetical protein
LRRGSEEKGKTTGKLAGGATESEGERKGGESRRALGLGEKERRWAGLAHAGRRKGGESWASGWGKKERERGPAGEGEGKEPEREKELGCWALFPLLPLFFSFAIL